MAKTRFYEVLESELKRVDAANVAKRKERIIEGFTTDPSPRGVIGGKPYAIFNSNDYLGLRHSPVLKKAEHEASDRFGAGPGAVRFISGSLSVYHELEDAIARFHGREAGMVFSSAFAANVAVLFSLIKGQSKDSKVSGNTLVISDQLNHRSIIDGIRVAGLAKEQKAVFAHLKPADAGNILEANKGKFDRAIIVTDGVFSMLGEVQKLSELEAVADAYDGAYPEGVLVVMDDAHGAAAIGKTGRGTEEVAGGRADVLIGTFGKGFGADGGYVVADRIVIDYLRESAATYIYSNSISPGTAGAALAAVKLVDSKQGEKLLAILSANAMRMKKGLTDAGLTMAADSIHAIQPLLTGDPAISKRYSNGLFEAGFLVTSINYPVVPKGRDEIRLQLSAAHTPSDIDGCVRAITSLAST